jgi:hypothetical protein
MVADEEPRVGHAGRYRLVRTAAGCRRVAACPLDAGTMRPPPKEGNHPFILPTPRPTVRQIAASRGPRRTTLRGES